MSAADPNLALAQLKELEGAIPISEVPKRYGVPKSSVYAAVTDGTLPTVTTAKGHRLVTPAALLEFLTAAGDRASRVKGVAKDRQRAAVRDQGAAA